MSESVEHAAAPVEEKKNIVPLSEIQKHKTHDDLWMAINGKVYNASPFVDQHPGGEEVLLEWAGTDATTAFDDVGHSETALELLEELYVGEGDPSELKIIARKQDTAGLGDIDGGSSNNILLLIVCTLVAGAAYFYFKAMKD